MLRTLDPASRAHRARRENAYRQCAIRLAVCAALAFGLRGAHGDARVACGGERVGEAGGSDACGADVDEGGGDTRAVRGWVRVCWRVAWW